LEARPREIWLSDHERAVEVCEGEEECVYSIDVFSECSREALSTLDLKPAGSLGRGSVRLLYYDVEAPKFSPARRAELVFLLDEGAGLLQLISIRAFFGGPASEEDLKALRKALLESLRPYCTAGPGKEKFTREGLSRETRVEPWPGRRSGTTS